MENKERKSLSRDELGYGVAALSLYRNRLRGLDPTGITPLGELAKMCDGALSRLSSFRGSGGSLTPAGLPADEAALLCEAVKMLTDELGCMASVSGSPLDGEIERLRGLGRRLRGRGEGA